MAKIARRRGRYVADYYSLDGRRQRKSFTLRKDAEAFLVGRVQEARAARTGQRPLKEATFGEYAPRWLENHSVNLKPWTADFYGKVLRVHLLPRFGQRPLQDIDREAVAGFKAKMVRAGKWSPRTVNHVLTTLKTVLNNAVMDGYISSSPAASVKPVKVVMEEKDFLRTWELRLLLDNARPRNRTLFLCALLTGMRQGELLALHWKCVDFASMQIRVRRSLYKGSFVEPKSARSRREIDMAPMLARALRELSSRFAGELVFPQPNGKPMNPSNLINR
jgi:integrase